MEFNPDTNLIYGDNAQGKTNILEAAYMVATTKSHRGSKDREMIRFGEEESHIKAVVTKDGVNHRVDMHLKKHKNKGIAIDGLPIRRAAELFGVVNIVFFSPEDLTIIKDGPAARRKFIDLELSQIDKIYLSDLTNYNKVLSQRNKLLKEYEYRKDAQDTLEVWDLQLLRYGMSIIERRSSFIMELNQIIQEIHKHLTGNREELIISYEPDVEKDFFANELVAYRQKDIRYGTTNVGPHKDDICFLINGNDVRHYGSQGQQRTAALSLKLSEIELVKQRIHDDPILFLDDVLSELDSNRQNFLLDSIHGIQTVVTCTGMDEWIRNRMVVNKVFHVVEGSVKAEN